MRHLFLRGAAAVVVVALVAAAGCATKVAEQRAALDQAAVCCRSHAEMPYADLPVGKMQSVRLGQGSPAFEFDSGKSYFYAARLPADGRPLVLSIESVGAIGTSETTSMFQPELLLLDAQFNVTRRVSGDGFDRSGGANLRGALFFNEENAAERYVVIYTKAAAGADGGKVSSFTPHTLYWYGAAITLDGSEQTLPLVLGPTGVLSLELQRYDPPVIGGQRSGKSAAAAATTSR